MQLRRVSTRPAGGIAIAGLLLLAACSSGNGGGGSAASTTTRVPAGATSAETAAVTPKQVAIALGRRMLDEAVLPAGARVSSAPAPKLLRGPSSIPEMDNLVYAHRLFTIGERPYDVYQWLQHHTPSGFRKGTTGFGTDRGIRSWDVEEDVSAQPANISNAALEFGIIGSTGGAGNTAAPAIVRVDSVVGWTAPRPADEFVPASDRFVTVSGVHPYEPGAPVGRHVTTSDPKLVGPIVRAFNQLRVEPPGILHGCPAMSDRSISYRVEFAASATAEPDVVATFGSCGGAVTVHGKNAPGLDFTTNEAFMDAAVRVLGMDQPHFH